MYVVDDLIEKINGGGRTAALLAACALVSACGVTPPLGRGLPAAIDDADMAFNARIHARFPAGSATDSLLEELQRERFHIDPRPQPDHLQIARYKKDGLPCRQDWIISWSANGSTIASVSGRYAVACL